MRSILINPYTRTIQEVTYSGDFLDAYRLMSWNEHAVSVIEIAGYGLYGDVVYVDEEGLFKQNRQYFEFRKKFFAGCGLIVGSKGEHDVSARMSLAEVSKMIGWKDV